MECYQYEDSGRACEAGKILDFNITLTNKKLSVSKNNPYMIGFQKPNYKQHVQKLLNNHMTVV